jgi:hypothetical protein
LNLSDNVLTGVYYSPSDFVYGLYENPIYDEKAEADLSMNFVLPLEFMTKWARCGATSDYLAQYQSINIKQDQQTQILMSSVINELMENAVKFSADKTKMITVSIQHYGYDVVIEAINITDKSGVDGIKNFVKKLESGSSYEDLFFTQLESSFKFDAAGLTSGIGILSILKDYSAKLGIRIEVISELNHTFRVYVQMLIPTNTVFS